MSEPILQLRDVSLSFKGIQALNALSFDVARGEICALIGPNGAGKSSLLNVINGVYRADSGDVIFDRQRFVRIHPTRAARFGIGRTFQHNALFKRLSVRDNVLAGLIRHSRPRSSSTPSAWVATAAKRANSTVAPTASSPFSS